MCLYNQKTQIKHNCFSNYVLSYNLNSLIIFIFGCKQDDDKNAIINYIQVQYNIDKENIKILSLENPSYITVGDSIFILNNLLKKATIKR